MTDIAKCYRKVLRERRDEINEQRIKPKIQELREELKKDNWSSEKVRKEYQKLYQTLNTEDQEKLGSRELIELLSDSESQLIEITSKNILSILSWDISEDKAERISRGIVFDKNEHREKVREAILRDIEEISEMSQADLNFSKFYRNLDKSNWEEIEDFLIEYSKNLLDKGWKEKDLENLPKRLETFDIELKRHKIKPFPTYILKWCYYKSKTNYRAIIKIPYIEYEEEIDVEGFTLVPSNERDYSYYEKNSKMNSVWKDSAKVSINRITENTFLDLNINAFGPKEANRNAKDRLSGFLDSLSFHNVSSKLDDPQYRNQLDMAIWSDRRFMSPSISKSRGLPAKLTEDRVEKLKTQLSVLNQDNPLSHRYSRALHFFRKGNIRVRDIEKCINYLAAIETLVNDEYQYGASITIQNTKKSINTSERNQNAFERALNNLYSARNSALHSGYRDFDIDNDLDIVRNLLGNFLLGSMTIQLDDGVDNLKGYRKKLEYITDQYYQDKREDLELDDFEVNESYEFVGNILMSSGSSFGIVEGKIIFEDDGGEVISNRILIENIVSQNFPLAPITQYNIEGILRNSKKKIKLKDTEFSLQRFFGKIKDEELPIEGVFEKYDLN